MAIEFKQADKPTKSTAARKDVQDHASRVGATSRKDTGKAGTQALPVDTPSKALSKVKKPVGSPPTGFNKTAYQRLYMRKRRAKIKLEKENDRNT